MSLRIALGRHRKTKIKTEVTNAPSYQSEMALSWEVSPEQRGVLSPAVYSLNG